MLRARAVLALLVVAACGSDDEPASEVVITDARLGGVTPQLLGASSTTVFWASPMGPTTALGAAAVASLPATGTQIATAAAPFAYAGDFVVFVDEGRISRVDGAGTVQRIVVGTPDALAGNSATPPIAAWTEGAVVAWGSVSAQMSATLIRVDTCDHARLSDRQIYLACDDSNGRRLVRVDQQTGVATGVTTAKSWGTMFPPGDTTGASYTGRIVDARDDGALWLVEEMPSRRAILVNAPVQGEPTVVLEHIMNATGFFVSADALYWQEGAELLTAPRTGGPAEIVRSLPGTAGGFADGYIYFTHGKAIERARIE